MRSSLPTLVGALFVLACSPATSDGLGTGGSATTGGSGTATGGTATGGTATGGTATGGTATGGTATGGTATGGTATGGTATGSGGSSGGMLGGSGPGGVSSGGSGGSAQGGSAGNKGGSGGISSGGAVGSGGASGSGGAAGALSGGSAGTAGASSCTGGKAIEFDGDAKTKMDATVGSTLPLGNASRTVEMWLYTVTKSWRAEHHLYQYGGTNPREGAFGIDFGDGPYPDVETYTNGTGDNHFKVPTATVKETGWFHFAMVWDGPTKTLKGVINGVTIGRKTLTVELTTTQSTLSIGYSPTFSGNGGFTGKIDELRVWNLARTDAEIASTMKQRLRGTESGLVAYFTFDEGTGTVSKDLVASYEAKFGNTAPKWASSEVELTCP